MAKETTVGNYFVSNYPPFSFWKPELVPAFLESLERPPQAGTPLGIYTHIPFCRKRCHFCYFRVYTDKDSASIRGYVEAVLKELAIYAGKPFVGEKKGEFRLFRRRDAVVSLGGPVEAPDGRDEGVDFLGRGGGSDVRGGAGDADGPQIEAIREMGVTRLSLGVENFDDHVLEINGRAHHSKEIARAYAYARELEFPQINIDLIAGMVEETDANWRECVRKTIEMSPDSVTIYQMEIPYNTTIYKEMKAEGRLTAPVADWEVKRAWVKYAFGELGKGGVCGGHGLHGGQEQGEDEVCLPGPAVGGGGFDRDGRGVVRPHSRDPLSEPA
jgi:oxygen-independent coproporphyrinogen-3 oxidase